MPAPVPGHRLPRYDDDATVLMKGRELNDIAKRIEESYPKAGRGVTARAGADGVELSILPVAPDYAPFAVVDITEDGADYELTFEPGRVVCADPVSAAGGDGDGYNYFVPEIDGEPMDEEDPLTGELPKLTVAPGEGVFCKVHRDEFGMVIEPVELVADTIGEYSDHYQPESPDDSGHASQHDLIRILDLTEDGGLPELKIWRKSDILLTPFLWTGENVGTGARVFKKYDDQDGTYDFRSLSGCWGAKVQELGDVIQVEAEAENIGEGESGFAATLLIERADEDPLLEICDQKMKIKSLGQGLDAGERQIRITDEDEIARIHGNGVDGTLAHVDCDDVSSDILTVEDGLVTSIAASFKAGCGDGYPSGSSGDMLYHDGTDWVALAAPALAPITAGTYEHYELQHDGAFPAWVGVV